MKVSTVTSAGENVLDAVCSFGKNVFEVFLWVGLGTAEGADVGAESGLHLAGELAVAFLVENERITGFIDGFNCCAKSGVDFASLGEELVDPSVSSGNSAGGGGGVVFHQIEESVHMSADLVQSLFGAKIRISDSSRLMF